jgi:hypothetical protein
MMDTTNGGEMILEIDVGHHLHPGGAIGIGMNPLIWGGQVRGIEAMIEGGEVLSPKIFLCRSLK